jgi:hypothetical protein
VVIHGEPGEGLIDQAFHGHVATTPHVTALLYESERFTYADVEARSLRVAQQLQAHGAGTRTPSLPNAARSWFGPCSAVGLCHTRSTWPALADGADGNGLGWRRDREKRLGRQRAGFGRRKGTTLMGPRGGFWQGWCKRRLRSFASDEQKGSPPGRSRTVSPNPKPARLAKWHADEIGADT